MKTKGVAENALLYIKQNLICMLSIIPKNNTKENHCEDRESWRMLYLLMFCPK